MELAVPKDNSQPKRLLPLRPPEAYPRAAKPIFFCTLRRVRMAMALAR